MRMAIEPRVTPSHAMKLSRYPRIKTSGWRNAPIAAAMEKITPMTSDLAMMVLTTGGAVKSRSRVCAALIAVVLPDSQAGSETLVGWLPNRAHRGIVAAPTGLFGRLEHRPGSRAGSTA